LHGACIVNGTNSASSSLSFNKTAFTLTCMKLNREVTRRLRTAVSALFVVQLLVSSFCMVSPASAAQTSISEHCHEQMQMSPGNMPVSQSSHHSSHHTADNGCAHCDMPQDLNTVSASHNISPVAVLLAVVTSANETLPPVSITAFSPEKAQAPPDSSGILLTTSQRLRI